MFKTLILASTFLVSHNCLAELTHSNTEAMVFPQEDYSSGKITSKDVEKVIPTGLTASDDMNAVAAKIVDRSIQSVMDSPDVKNSILGQTATSVQKKMSADITVKSSEPQGVEHKFSMQFLAFQTMAKVQYTGWLNAVFNYDAKAAQSMVEFSEKIFNKDLFVNHTSSSKEDTSSVGIKWGW